MFSVSSTPLAATLSQDEIRSRAFAFSKAWIGHQREEAEAKTFLDQFFAVFGRDRRSVDARFEHHVERETGDGRIDLFWRGQLIVEMKTTGRDLSTEKGGAARQAFEYVDDLDPEDRPRWVLVSDFAHFVLYDLGEEVHEYLKGLASARKAKPTIAAQFTLEDLPDKLHHFRFIRSEEQDLFQTQPQVNLQAVELLGELHDELKKFGYAGHKLERFLVRVLFCLFAEDTGIFSWNSFTRFVQKSKKDGSDIGTRLAKLFEVLNQDGTERSNALPPEFAEFPYVNGGLFAEGLNMADFTAEQRAALLQCCQFDWSRISPSVFGSLFQGVMDKKERRAKGAHYTSEENIRRVIDPLFLDTLKAEFADIVRTLGKKIAAKGLAEVIPLAKRSTKPKTTNPLDAFHDKIASLRFLDPACGCGNFLVVAYRELRGLELEVLKAEYGDQLPLGLEVGDLARINVDQFYGIEIEDFPSLIAETALWLTDHQVNMAFSKAFGKHYIRIPLKKSPTIVNKNALRIDWGSVLPAAKCDYVLGNPPFIGKKEQDAAQKLDMANVCGAIKGYGILDYVSAWYVKAAQYIRNTSIRCAFFSTNSICQGEQVGVIWPYLLSRGIYINFAHRTFIWHNEAKGKAHVHVIIVGFSLVNAGPKTIAEYVNGEGEPTTTAVRRINPYLIEFSDVVLGNQSESLCDVPPVSYGSFALDDGHYTLSASDRRKILDECPDAEPMIREFKGGKELIRGHSRWCLWLKGADPGQLRRMPAVMSRVNAVREWRATRDRETTRELALTPTLFAEIRQPSSPYLAFPTLSSVRRRYIPIAFLDEEIIASNQIYVVGDATSYEFGILTSEMHMAWVRTVAGRFKSDYRYSAGLVYNNFPWPRVGSKKRKVVEECAKRVLDARRPYLNSGSSLADLYDPSAMPPDLIKAHQALDQAVDKCYRSEVFVSERERVEYLFGLYEKLVRPLARSGRVRRAVPPSGEGDDSDDGDS